MVTVASDGGAARQFAINKTINENMNIRLNWPIKAINIRDGQHRYRGPLTNSQLSKINSAPPVSGWQPSQLDLDPGCPGQSGLARLKRSIAAIRPELQHAVIPCARR